MAYSRDPFGGVVVGMLVVRGADARNLVGIFLLGRTEQFRALDVDDRRMPAFLAELETDWDQVRRVERTDGQRDALAFEILEEQRRAAILAEAAVDVLGTAEHRGGAAGPSQVLVAHADQRG